MKSFIGWGLQAITPYSLDESGCYWQGQEESTVLANGYSFRKVPRSESHDHYWLRNFLLGLKVKSFIGWGLQEITPYSLDESGCYWLGPKERTVLANGYHTVLEQWTLLAKNCVATDKATQKREKMRWMWALRPSCVSGDYQNKKKNATVIRIYII